MKKNFIFKFLIIGAFLILNLIEPVKAIKYPSIMIVVNKKNEINSITMSSLRSIFLMEKLFWENNRKILIALLNNNTQESFVFNEKVYKMNSNRLKRFLFAKIFKGELLVPPSTFNTDKNLIEFISKNPDAIGYINSENYKEIVKVLSVDGVKEISLINDK